MSVTDGRALKGKSRSFEQSVLAMSLEFHWIWLEIVAAMPLLDRILRMGTSGEPTDTSL